MCLLTACCVPFHPRVSKSPLAHELCLPVAKFDHTINSVIEKCPHYTNILNTLIMCYIWTSFDKQTFSSTLFDKIRVFNVWGKSALLWG